MEKYLLLEERKKVHSLITDLANKLKKKEEELQMIEQQLETILKETRDSSLEEILNHYTNSFLKKMQPLLLEEQITPAIQVGIQNEYFSIFGYGGHFNNQPNSSPIQENTFFSFDSISKLILATTIMRKIREKELTLHSLVSDLNLDFALDTSIESILKFTAMIRTEQRIDHLPKEDTLAILKKCKENLEEKNKYKNFYEYNDIGYMILRASLDNCLEQVDSLLQDLNTEDLTYQWQQFTNQITGGKLTEEYITPDPKGRDILFPGHTGIYGNIKGLLQLYQNILYTENILTKEEKEQLFQQPYPCPIVYSKEGNPVLRKENHFYYMAKIAGIYRKPNGILESNYNKLASCDMSNLTTDSAKVSTGTCGSWVIGDNLFDGKHFGTYQGGILSNPYSMVHIGSYPHQSNPIPNSNLSVNQKGIILGYSTKLNPYKEAITEYGLLLTIMTDYIKEMESHALEKKTYQKVKKIEQ